MRYISIGLILCSVAFVGCEPFPQSNYIVGDSHYKNEIRYFRDTRTGICFAERMSNGPSGYAFTSVDCEKVDEYHRKNGTSTPAK